MANAANPEASVNRIVDRAVFFLRLSDELSILGVMAGDLQGALHNLPLEESDHATRKVLQSADKLTQSLDCLSAALGGVSNLPLTTREYDMAQVLKGVYLEDLRDRLTHGTTWDSEQDRRAPGELDLF